MLLTGFVVHDRDQRFFCFMRGQQFQASKSAANRLAPQLYVSMNPLSVTTEVPLLTHDQLLIRAIYTQVPPAARAITTHTTAFPLTQPGDGIFTALVGELVDGPAHGPARGTIVTCYADWEEYSIVPVSQIRPLAAEGSLFHHLGLLGHNGLAAYFGIEGFLTADFMSEWSDALDQLAGWAEEDQLKAQDLGRSRYRSRGTCGDVGWGERRTGRGPVGPDPASGG
jgi:NADPH-dependent curcumin reductase CurA